MVEIHLFLTFVKDNRLQAIQEQHSGGSYFVYWEEHVPREYQRHEWLHCG